MALPKSEEVFLYGRLHRATIYEYEGRDTEGCDTYKVVLDHCINTEKGVTNYFRARMVPCLLLKEPV